MDEQRFIRDRIIELIDLNHMNEVQLSRAIGKSDGYIQGVTSGRRSIPVSVIGDICRYFGISIGDFFNPDYPIDGCVRMIIDYSLGMTEERRKLYLQIAKALAESE